MINFFLFPIFLLNFIISSSNVGAEVLEFNIPQLSAPVVDEAKVLSETTKTKINGLLKKVYNEGGSQVQVLIVDSLQGFTIEEASIKVATKWALGHAQKDNGVLLFIAINDRQVRIEVGQGLEGDLTDAYSKRIVDQIIVPLFKSGDFNQGVLQGVLGILKYTDSNFKVDDLVSEYDRSLYKRNTNSDQVPFWLRILILLVFLIIIFNINTGPGNHNRYYGSTRGSSYRGGGGFSGGGSGWSGGGGGFSGGGSSGRW